MATSKGKAPSHNTPADSTAAVDTFMRALDHPQKKELEAIRRAILGVSPAIAEGIKWNAPSFRTSEYFATMNLRQKDGMAVVLHLGAKRRALLPGGVVVEDPAALLKWLDKDRAIVVFSNLEDFKAKQAAFEQIVRQWIGRM